MRKLSQAALALIGQLGSADSPPRLTTLFAEIGDRHEPAALTALLPYLVDPLSSVAKAARQVAQQLLDETPPQELGWLEQEIRWRSRRGTYYFDAKSVAARWQSLQGDALIRMSGEPGASVLSAIASFHDSGYVREAAVYLLNRRTDGGELPYLLVRLNDWVRPVRRAAQASIERRFLPEYAAGFLRNIYLCDRLAEQRRNDSKELRDSVRTLLRSEHAQAARAAALLDDDRHVRRAAFQLASESNDDLRATVLLALRSDDLWVRIFAARTARARLYGPALRETLGQARGDRSVPVRREALLGFVADYPELRESLLDSSASLREMVRFYLRKNANLDFAELYRAELPADAALAASKDVGAGARLAIALSGLGETGTAADAGPIARFAADPRPRVKQAALLALGRLDGDAHLSTLLAALVDRSSGVVRAALQALGSRVILCGKEVVAAYLAQENPLCRRHLVGALATLPRWQSLRELLRAAGDSDNDVSALAQRLLSRWLEVPNYTRPTAEERAAVIAQLGEIRLPAALRHSIYSVLKEWPAS